MQECFEICSNDGKARTGILRTAHFDIPTPLFMPVATKGSVKFCDMQRLHDTGAMAIITNSLLLYLRPGLENIEKAGGLHKFIGWNKGIFTDSGGFQILDDYLLIKTTNMGANFKSPYDGKKHWLTPQLSVEIQSRLGSDVAMVLDDVPKYSAPRSVVENKLKRTISWAKEFIDAHKQTDSRQIVFCIAQGGVFKDLRKKSIIELSKLDFNGMALGGLAIGEPIKSMLDTVKFSASLMPKKKPRYLMGVGSPLDMLEAVSLGIDIFDSTMPTKNGRHGTLFTMKGMIRIDKKEFGTDMRPIDETCSCFVCKNYSRAYLQHQIRMEEPTGKLLCTHHNLFFMQRLIREAREAIDEKKFEKYKESIKKVFKRN
ncbi:MAG: tRNA guanosine(34) transglycosylase Tgt [Candidatus Woesearchaeota archaeon]